LLRRFTKLECIFLANKLIKNQDSRIKNKDLTINGEMIKLLVIV